MVSLNVLSNCLVDPDVMDDIRNSGGLDQLLAFINESYPSVEVKLYAAQAIGRAAKNGEIRARVRVRVNIVGKQQKQLANCCLYLLSVCEQLNRRWRFR